MTADKAAIVAVGGREVLDSRGWPTVEAEIRLAGGIVARSSAPAGASVGAAEAKELRDGEKRMGGRGVRRAVAALNGDINAALRGMDSRRQADIDAALVAADNSEDKSRLGANAILAASLAAAIAGARAEDVWLHQHLGGGTTMPMPLMNIINGGAHAANNLDIQEFMIVPAGFDDFPSALFAGAEIFHALKDSLRRHGHATAVGDEGGFAPDLRGTREALDLLMESIAAAGFEPGRQVMLALDCAASEFCNGGVYELPGENFRGDSAALTEWLAALRDNYPIASIEDGCDENDWEGWRRLTERLGGRTQLVGDDLFATNIARLQKGADSGAANALLAKPNQIGTVTETKEAAAAARRLNYRVILSHRSGDTERAELADLAVAWDAGQIKTGAPCRGERTAKYNRLLTIADELGAAATYPGVAGLNFLNE